MFVGLLISTFDVARRSSVLLQLEFRECSEAPPILFDGRSEFFPPRILSSWFKGFVSSSDPGFILEPETGTGELRGWEDICLWDSPDFVESGSRIDGN